MRIEMTIYGVRKTWRRREGEREERRGWTIECKRQSGRVRQRQKRDGKKR